MAAQHPTGGVRSATHLGLPVAVRLGQFDFAEDQVDDRVQDLVLVGDVVIDRHRLDAELLGQRPDRERREAPRVGDCDCAAQDAISAERHALRRLVAH